MASKYTLHYFNLAGRAEPARMLFHIAGVEFTDHLITFAEWPSYKLDASKFPLGQLPTLEVNGEVICQARAIIRFIAEELNLYGSSNMDRCVIDQVHETIMEVKEKLYTIKFKDSTLDDDQKKAAALKEYFETAGFKTLLSFLTSKIKGKFFLGDNVSYADASYYTLHEFIEACGAPMDQYPQLTAVKNAVAEIPAIKKYLKSRQYGW